MRTLVNLWDERERSVPQPLLLVSFGFLHERPHSALAGTDIPA